MKVLREPLLHFLLLGAAIFGAYRLRSDARATRPGSIVVTEGRIEALVAAFTARQRPPTASEREGLIRDYIRERSTSARRSPSADQDDRSSAAGFGRSWSSSPRPRRQAEPTDGQQRVPDRAPGRVPR
jgi:hypothetical protein